MDWLISAVVAFTFVAVIGIMAWAFAPKGWRTVAANTMAAVGVVLFPLIDYLASVQWNTAFDAKTALLISVFLGGLNIALRRVTDTQLGVK